MALEFPPLLDIILQAPRETLPTIMGKLGEAQAAVIARLASPLPVLPPEPQNADAAALPLELTPEDIKANLQLKNVGMIYRLRVKGRNPLPMRHVGKYLRCSRAEYLAWKSREIAIARGRR